MASASVLGAYLERYNTFTVAATVKLYVTFVPPKNSAEAAVNPPLGLLEDLGTEPTEDFELNPIEVTRLKHTLYAASDADVDSYASAVRYNGAGIGSGSGMDFAASMPLTGLTLLECRREREVRGRASFYSISAQPLFFCEMTYRITCLRTA
jgi:hypothetical protein